MESRFYQYGNIIRILNLEDDFSRSVMVDVELDNGEILSEFVAVRKFDADFIKSFLNIIECSNTGFRLLSDSPKDFKLKALATQILKGKELL